MQCLEFSSILGNFVDFYGVCWTIWISESLNMHFPQCSMNCPECSGLFIMFWLMLSAFSQSFKTKLCSLIFWTVLKVENCSETMREWFEFILRCLLTVLTIPWHLRSPRQSGSPKHILECIMFPQAYEHIPNTTHMFISSSLYFQWLSGNVWIIYVMLITFK